MWLFDKRKLHNIEYTLLFIVLGLLLFGILSILAVHVDPFDGEGEPTLLQTLSRLSFVTVRKQAIWIAVSTVVMACVAMLDYHVYSKIWLIIVGICTALIIVTSFLGTEHGGTRGWITVTDSFSFQPTEIGKLGLVLVLAKVISKKEKLETVNDLLPAFGVMIVFVGALLTQMDIGTSLVYVFVFIIMLFSGGMSWKHIFILFGGCILACVALWFIMGEKQRSRIINFVSGEEVDQLRNAKYAISTAGFFGKGIFGTNLLCQSGSIFAVDTDFIFSAIIESMGFFGGIFLILLYVLLEIRMWYLATHKAHDRYGRLIIIGIMAMLMFHIFENIGMVIGIMPITGIPLPFISYGGSSMLTNMIGIGLVESVCMNRPIEPFTGV